MAVVLSCALTVLLLVLCCFVAGFLVVLARAPVVIGQCKSKVPAAAADAAGFARAGQPVRVGHVEDAGAGLGLDVVGVRRAAALDRGLACRGGHGRFGLLCARGAVRAAP